MSGIQAQTNKVMNYMVPAAGQTHAVTFNGVFSATPFAIDWRQFVVDNFPFVPQGVFIDNSQGAGELTITVQPLGYNVICPAGSAIQAQFPAPLGQTATITGNGQAVVYFVDFPVLPNGSQVAISGTPNVNISGASNNLSPVYVTVPVNAGGLPYQYQKTVLPLTCEYLSTTGAAVNVAPGANQYLRKLLLTVSGDAALAAAAKNLITVSLNGTAMMKVSPYIPAAAGTGQGWQWAMAFDDAALAAGGGNLTLQAASVLTGGLIELNAYFD